MTRDRSRTLNKNLAVLFPRKSEWIVQCNHCGHRASPPLDALPWIVDRLEAGCTNCGGNLTVENFSHGRSTDSCRVCGESVSARREAYCSGRCRDIAYAVQRMFTWTHVRERVLDRDGHACQNDGCDAAGEDADLHVDHIRELQDDGHPFDERNLITLCDDCHATKTHGDTVVTSGDAPGLSLDGDAVDVPLSEYMD